MLRWGANQAWSGSRLNPNGKSRLMRGVDRSGENDFRMRF
jgi:hypothetical protein